ncbi:unnamed protein product [Ceutorhynchus assimilis]|uniref:Uncharacterized protein n=1 Tax=Ceutorhynchus assimilis TaxID=467358 RepID=A0A9N9MVC7_9CUCU|nr:unnamed protein product [Ceutorhynchus assimilis]
MNNRILHTSLFAILCINTKLNFVNGICEDWSICELVDCAKPQNPCPKDKPYLVYDDCGCCQFCSENPKTGPCGTCGKDLVCKDDNPYPTCKRNQIISIDYCGCCRVCKTVVGEGGKCSDKGPSYTVCKKGLKCIDGTCRKSC